MWTDNHVYTFGDSLPPEPLLANAVRRVKNYVPYADGNDPTPYLNRSDILTRKNHLQEVCLFFLIVGCPESNCLGCRLDALLAIRLWVGINHEQYNLWC